MGDAFAAGELDQRVGDALALELDHARAKMLGEADVVHQGAVRGRSDTPRLLARRLHVHGVPVGRQPAGDPRPGAQQLRRAAARRHGHHHLFRNRRVLEPFALAILVRLLGLVHRQLAQRQLAKRGQIALAKEVGERLLDLLDAVDLALQETRAQRLDRDIDVDDLVGAVQEPVGNGLAHVNAAASGDHVVQRLDVLNVDRRDHRDAGVEQLEDVFVSLLVRRARGVGVRQLVHEHDLRLARLDRLDVHLLDLHVPIGQDAAPHHLQPVDQGDRVGAAVRLDVADDDVDALTPELVRVLEHLVGLADPWRRADVHTKTSPVALVELGEQRRRVGAPVFGRLGCHLTSIADRPIDRFSDCLAIANLAISRINW